MNTTLAMSLIALACVSVPDALAQGVDCGETGIDAMGLRMLDDDGNWRYLTPFYDPLTSRQIALTYPDGSTQERWVRTMTRTTLVSRLEPTFGPGRARAISQCWEIVAVLLDGLYPGQFPLVAIEEDGALPRGWQLPLFDTEGRSKGSLFAIAGNDLASWEDDLFVLQDDGRSGGAIALIGLDASQAGALSGVSAEIAADFATRGVTKSGDLEIRFDQGAIDIEVEVRDRDGKEQKVRFSQPADAAVDDPAPPGAGPAGEESAALSAEPAKIGEGASSTLEVTSWFISEDAPWTLGGDEDWPSGSGLDWWGVDVRIINRSDERLEIVPPNLEIFLLDDAGTRYPLLNLELRGGAGEMGATFDDQGRMVFTTALGPGAEAEVRLFFLAPADEMELRFLDVTPIALDLDWLQ